MNKKYLSALILISGILSSGAIIGLANAQTATLDDIQYPIQELGNCKSKDNCKTFCDNSKNSEACLTFAEQHNLMSQKELTKAKKFQDNGMTGPGKCKGQDECEQYCGISTHMEECISFAKENGMMSDQQLQESEKVLAAIKNGIKPPACSGPKQCNAYCSNPKNMEECMTFSIAAGIIPEGQKVQMQKTLEAIKQGAKPPACQPTPPSDQSSRMLPGQTDQPVQPGQGLESCDTYCSTHSEECMSFSLAAGMVPDDQKEQIQKSLNAIKQGIKPPACRPKPPTNPEQLGQKEQQNDPSQPRKLNQSVGLNNKPDQFGKDLQDCEQYCADSSHVEECVKFSVAMGNMSEKQAENAIKNGNKGPGGCVGRDACDAFCSEPNNQETCFNFGKDNGMISEEDLQRMQEGQQKMKDNFSSIPPEVLDCITSSSGADVVEKMKTGSVTQRSAGDSINQCFQKFGTQERRPDQNQNNQEERGQQNQQIQPWADMCKPDENGNQTSLACADGSGNFVISAKVGEDGSPICPEGSSAKCGNYEQQNQQGQGQDQRGQGGNRSGGPNQGQGFNPGSGNVNPGNQQMPQQAGPGGCKGPEECQKYCDSNPEVCKNFQPQQNQQGQGQNQKGQNGGPNKGQGFNPGSGVNGNGPGLNQGDSGQPFQPDKQGKMQPQQQQLFRFDQGQQGGSIDLKKGDCGTGPGTCSGIGPDDINPGGNRPGGPNQGQGFNPGSGQNGNGPGDQGGQGQPRQPDKQGQVQPQQQLFRFDQGQSGQQGGPSDLKQGDCGTGPGTCSGIGPDDRNPGQFNQPNSNQPGQPNQFNPLNQPNPINQPGQSGSFQPEQQQQPQFQPPPLAAPMQQQ